MVFAATESISRKFDNSFSHSMNTDIGKNILLKILTDSKTVLDTQIFQKELCALFGSRFKRILFREKCAYEYE